MLKRKAARSTWVLGLITILCTYNLAYANVKVGENTGATATKERTDTSKVVSNVKDATIDSRATTTPATMKASLIKKTARLANSCACSCSSSTGRAAAAPDLWWDCMKGCLRSWGVSPTQIAICGATCALGNIPLCAFCVGLDISIFMLCSIGCRVYAGNFDTGEGHEPILTRKTPSNNMKKAERRTVEIAARK